MSLKQRKRGTKPIKLKDAIYLYPTDRSQYEGLYLRYSDFEGSEQHPGCWPQMTETEQELAHILTAADSIHYYSSILQMPYILTNLYNNFGERYLLSKFYEYIDTWDGTNEDMHSISDSMQDELFRCIKINRYKWTKLYESTIAEFNPLYNVDAYEDTTRTLEQDGTVRNAKTGTETSAKTGTETGKKTGTETGAKTGTETSAKTGTERTLTDESTEDKKTGTETLAKSGAEAMTYNTTDTTGYAGSEATTHQKAMTTTESVTTTESSTFYDTKKTVDAGIANDNVDTLEYSQDRADTKTKTGTETTSFTNRQDQTTYNTTDTIEHDNDVTLTHNTQDQLTHNTTDTMTYNTTDQLTHNTQDQITHNTTDTETRDLLDTERIIHRRYGNIGITMSTQLLESFRSFVNYHLIDIIAHDLAEYITQGVY